MKTIKLDYYDWKEFRKEGQQRKARRRDELTGTIENFCLTRKIVLDKLTPYHFRLKRAGFDTVDIYPTSSKVKVQKKNSLMRTVDLYKWLKKFYENA